LTTRLSISVRLTLWFSAIFLAGFVAFGLTMDLDLARSLDHGRNRTLSRRAERALEQIEASRNETSREREIRFADFSQGTPEGNLIHFLDADGRTWYPREPAPRDFPWPPLPGRRGERFVDVSFAGHPYRVLQRAVVEDGRMTWILVGGQLDDNRLLLSRFHTGLLAAIPLLLVASALSGYFLSRRALQPVDRITSALRSINIGNLSRRLPVNPPGDELQRLAGTCNDMLARLEDAVARIERFTADASHELRSPLSLIRGVSEYALRNPDLPPDAREAFEEVLAESVEAAGLLEDMLTLARADAGSAGLAMESIDLCEVLLDVCQSIRPLADAKSLALEVHAKPGGRVDGHRASLRRLLWTLLDNAVKYTPAGGRIEALLSTSPGEARITVADTGIGIPAALQPRIFERFFRADPSRGQVEGSGLGLAIARWIADIHHATLRVHSTEQVGSEFIVAFPARPGQ